MLPLNEVQTAIYDALTAALSVPVLDSAAGRNQAFPYVTIGDGLANQADALTNEAIDIDETIQVWSRQAGSREVNTLMAQIKTALHDKTLTVPAGAAFQFVTMRFMQAQPLPDIDGVTMRGVMRFTVYTFSK